jgi:hypothetical protein
LGKLCFGNKREEANMRKIVPLSYLCIIILFFFQPSFGAWNGPVEVIGNGWGDGESQVGFEKGDSHDGFPYYFDVSASELILVSDVINGRIKLYDSDGLLLQIIVPPVENPRDWIIEPKFVDLNIILILNKFCFLSLNGEIIAQVDIPGKIESWEALTNILYVEIDSAEQQWFIYSSTGDLIRVDKEKPPELGNVKENKVTEGYNYIVEYPDLTDSNIIKKQTLAAPETISEIKRDRNGNFYAIAAGAERDSNDIVYRYDIDGNFTGKLQIPPNEKVRENIPKRPTAKITTIAEYGQAFVAPSGNIYTWKRTPEKFSIIKWTWLSQ